MNAGTRCPYLLARLIPYFISSSIEKVALFNSQESLYGRWALKTQQGRKSPPAGCCCEIWQIER